MLETINRFKQRYFITNSACNSNTSQQLSLTVQSCKKVNRDTVSTMHIFGPVLSLPRNFISSADLVVEEELKKWVSRAHIMLGREGWTKPIAELVDDKQLKEISSWPWHRKILMSLLESPLLWQGAEVDEEELIKWASKPRTWCWVVRGGLSPSDQSGCNHFTQTCPCDEEKLFSLKERRLIYHCYSSRILKVIVCFVRALWLTLPYRGLLSSFCRSCRQSQVVNIFLSRPLKSASVHRRSLDNRDFTALPIRGI